MKKRAAALPMDVLVIVIIAVLVLVLTVIFYGVITGQQIFPAIMERIKMALGMLNKSQIKVP